MLRIGTQYYRAPTPDESQWDSDIAQARRSGLDSFRFWLMWNWYSRYEDKYDFASLGRLLDTCHKHGMKAILLFNLESAPAWLVRKYPDSVYRDATGGLYMPESVGNTPSGGFPGMCFHNSHIVEHGKLYISQLVHAFRDHPAVDCWEPHNEPMFEPGRYNDHFYCYCDHTIGAFRTRLQEKYASIDALNADWRRNYGCFEEVQPPRRRGMYNDWLDWRTFALETLEQTLRWRIDTIRAADSAHPVMIHTRGGSGVTRNLAKEGIDDYRMASMVDKYGTAAFPQCGPEHEYYIAMTGARCAARGKEFWMAELQAGPYGMGVHRNDAEPVCEYCGSSTMEATIDRKEGVFDPGSVTPERLAMWSWSGVAQGAKGIMYWQYRNESFGLEYGFGLTNLDGTPHARLEAVGKFAKTIRAHEKLFDNATLPRSDIAIAWDPSNDIINWTAVGCADAVKNSIKGIHKALWHCDYPVDVARLDTDVVDDDLTRYRVIYVPFSPRITTASAAKLERYVQQGGTLVCEGSSAQFDDTMSVSNIVPGAGLDVLFGCRRADVRTMHRSMIPALVIGSRTIRTRMHKEILEATGGKVIGRFESGEPAVIENKRGKGRAIYIGSNPFMSYATDDCAPLRAWVNEINKGCCRPVWCNQPDVAARVLEGERYKLVFIMNTLAKPVSVKTTVAHTVVKARAEELTGARVSTIERRSGAMIISGRIEPYGVRVYRIDQ